MSHIYSIPVVSFSISTAENGWIINRVDSNGKGVHGSYVFTDWEDASAFLKSSLNIIYDIREQVKQSTWEDAPTLEKDK